MRLSFAKYEGLGNDFIVVDATDTGDLSIEVARRLCDRHRGVGADGVLLVGPEPSMRVINADGSVPEMCGNGLRCVALHLARHGRAGAQSFSVGTGAGPHPCRVLSAERRGMVEVGMRPASLAPSEVPVDASTAVIEQPFEVAGTLLHVTAVSMGNPHAVVFDDVGDERLQLGPVLGADARFPQGANVGFARVRDDGGLALSVFERGAGWTQACGTGACAAAVAAIESGRIARGNEVEVHLPGGALRILVGEPGSRIQMTGPAAHVFDGEIEL